MAQITSIPKFPHRKRLETASMLKTSDAKHPIAIVNVPRAMVFKLWTPLLTNAILVHTMASKIDIVGPAMEINRLFFADGT
jgi:hypothetical protein